VATIITREVGGTAKGSPLTNAEVDNNFIALNTAKAELASPALTGTPTAPTAVAGVSTTQLATTAFVTTAVNLKADAAYPVFTGSLQALNGVYGIELGASTNYPYVDFHSSSTSNDYDARISCNASKTLTFEATGVAFTATPTAPTAAAGTNTTQLATTAFVTTAIASLNALVYAGL
jgi:hypothetical protein